MRNVLGRILILVAETLERSLLTVPEVDEYDPPAAGLSFPPACRNEMTYRTYRFVGPNSQPDRKALPCRQNRDGDTVLDRGRRAWQPRHLVRPSPLDADVLHHRGQLRHRRQQHPGVLHPRSIEVRPFHSLAEAPGRQQPARPRHAVGLLHALSRIRAPGRRPDGRRRHISGAVV